MNRHSTIAGPIAGAVALVGLSVMLAWRFNDHAPSSRGESATHDELALHTYLGILAPESLDLYREAVQSPLAECIEGAVQTCGEGEVCSVCVYRESCSFQCRNDDGSCPPAPPCGPPPDSDSASDPRRTAN